MSPTDFSALLDQVSMAYAALHRELRRLRADNEALLAELRGARRSCSPDERGGAAGTAVERTARSHASSDLVLRSADGLAERSTAVRLRPSTGVLECADAALLKRGPDWLASGCPLCPLSVFQRLRFPAPISGALLSDCGDLAFVLANRPWLLAGPERACLESGGALGGLREAGRLAGAVSAVNAVSADAGASAGGNTRGFVLLGEEGPLICDPRALDSDIPASSAGAVHFAFLESGSLVILSGGLLRACRIGRRGGAGVAEEWRVRWEREVVGLVAVGERVFVGDGKRVEEVCCGKRRCVFAGRGSFWALRVWRGRVVLVGRGGVEVCAGVEPAEAGLSAAVLGYSVPAGDQVLACCVFGEFLVVSTVRRLLCFLQFGRDGVVEAGRVVLGAPGLSLAEWRGFLAVGCARGMRLCEVVGGSAAVRIGREMVVSMSGDVVGLAAGVQGLAAVDNNGCLWMWGEGAWCGSEVGSGGCSG